VQLRRRQLVADIDWPAATSPSMLDAGVELDGYEPRLQTEKFLVGPGPDTDDLSDRRRVARVERIGRGRQLLPEIAVALRILVETDCRR
jgi:hypothetical protein